MIIHIGFETCVQSEDVVAILNKATAASASATAGFLRAAKKKNGFTPCAEREKAYVLTEKQGAEHIYASAINAATLEKRLKTGGLSE